MKIVRKLAVLSSMSLMLMAFQCDDDSCDFETFGGYKISVENNNRSYAVDDTFYLTASTPPRLTNYCDGSQASAFINEPERFFDGFFFVKLKEPTDLPLPYNGDVAKNNFELALEIGNEYNRDLCESNKLFELLPALTIDQTLFQYKLAITPKIPGDYALTIAYYGTFTEVTDTHQDILNPYSETATLRFMGCNDRIYERSWNDETFYFTVTE